MGQRAAGILLHPTSLPHHDGGLAAAARPFLEWAQRASIGVWQILPVGPPGEGHSPYAALSAFAGDASWFPPSAASPGKGGRDDTPREAWLDDWAVYAALKAAHAGAPWIAWDEPLRLRDPKAIAETRRSLGAAIDAHLDAQRRFEAGWAEVRTMARDHGVEILGDVPIYPALDSADVWSHQESFELDDDGAPTRVAGVPPDYFSTTGQLWGNPLYRWERLRENGYAWWIERLQRGLALHDRLRLDHFRGFAAYWAVPAEAETAEPGEWVPGPGADLFESIRRSLGAMPFVAEDLGVITEDVVALRKSLALPGMRVLQFGFDSQDGEHAPHQIPEDVVVYTGTHDNDTTRGWFSSLDADAKARVLAAVGGTAEHVSWGLIKTAYESAAGLAVVPLQDVLDLGSEARMNVPGVARGNWRFKAPADAFGPERAGRLRDLAERTGRGC